MSQEDSRNQDISAFSQNVPPDYPPLEGEMSTTEGTWKATKACIGHCIAGAVCVPMALAGGVVTIITFVSTAIAGCIIGIPACIAVAICNVMCSTCRATPSNGRVSYKCHCCGSSWSSGRDEEEGIVQTVGFSQFQSQTNMDIPGGSTGGGWTPHLIVPPPYAHPLRDKGGVTRNPQMGNLVQYDPTAIGSGQQRRVVVPFGV
ncbi:hypothetical protein BXZ70DRAFT_1013252 [Cristinia sonorae]|uniref:Uncharacterized protein n=1 Tax=Cristinia sonorae TaxID=1940300 RepID=A0A8K0UCQ7_9AGAR|nr:hypothetical protein BXZ70DRAFT_1013252 [Cristinia sonorae]